LCPGRNRLERRCQAAGSTRGAQFRSRRPGRPCRTAAAGQQHQPRARRWRRIARGTQAIPEIDIDKVFELGVVLAARALWEELGIGQAIRDRVARAALTAPHEIALLAMAANRLEDPSSKLACAERWLPDIAWLPEASGIAVDQLYRALDCLAVWSEEIERSVFLRTADLFRLDVDLIFYDTTTAYFEIDDPDEDEQE